MYALNLPYIEGVLAGVEQLFERTLIDQSGRTRHTQTRLRGGVDVARAMDARAGR
ncbi:hypothetical protein ABGB19_07455 [Mycobacterium sp. B14F4]|uniref:hypothetical protein n=1 Tax=Mycobacterium sp. B14F4 TaxID=3153565 RepID=UPI00325D5D4B